MSRVFDASQIGANAESITTSTSAPINNTSAFTTSVWIYPTAFGVVFVKDVLLSSWPNLAVVNAGGEALNGQVSATGTFANSVSSDFVPLNTWSNIISTYDDAGDRKLHFYINGVEVAYQTQDAAVGTIFDNSATGFIFGNDTFNDGFDGRIAEIALWNTVLTPTQIGNVAASTTGVASIAAANLVGYWHLCGLNSPEPDVSGNGNDGVLSANPPTTGSASPGFSGCVSPPSRCYNVGPVFAQINTPFSVTVTSTDNFDNVSPVTQDTDILLSVFTGTGTLSGTVTGTILSGQSSAVISGVLYNVAESGVEFTAASTSGDSLAPFYNFQTTTFYTSVGPFARWAPPTITFGYVPVSGTKQIVVSLYNDGPADLNISADNLTGDAAFTVPSTTIGAGPYPVGLVGTATIQYDPTVAANATGTLSLVSDDPDTPTVLRIGGTSVPHVPIVAGSGSQQLGTRKKSQTRINTVNKLIH